jgi:hypothetical protein
MQNLKSLSPRFGKIVSRGRASASGALPAAWLLLGNGFVHRHQRPGRRECRKGTPKRNGQAESMRLDITDQKYHCVANHPLSHLISTPAVTPWKVLLAYSPEEFDSDPPESKGTFLIS